MNNIGDLEERGGEGEREREGRQKGIGREGRDKKGRRDILHTMYTVLTCCGLPPTVKLLMAQAASFCVLKLPWASIEINGGIRL